MDRCARQHNLTTLEGIPRFFCDDAEHPHCCGTGTEEWAGGGDYWGGRNTTMPLAGHPCGHPDPPRKVRERKDAVGLQRCANPLDMVHSAYRFLLADAMPFGRNARIGFEHGGENETNEHYEAVSFWYGLPVATLVRTDELDVGDGASEREHGYAAPEGTAVNVVESRYERGVDHLDGEEIYPPHTDTERHHTGVSIFQLAIRPDNEGVMLRRKFDYLYPNQRAEVFVRHDGEWVSQGHWYTPGSNTSVLAKPKTHKSKPEAEDEAPHNEERTVNRRFCESEFNIGAEFTRGKERLELRIVAEPVERDLWPGHPFPERSAWSEIRYWAYCHVLPELPSD